MATQIRTKCGKKVGKAAKFCPHCGGKLAMASSAEAPKILNAAAVEELDFDLSLHRIGASDS